MTSTLTTPRPPWLPTFDAPPLTEVVLGVQFNPIGLKSWHYAKFLELYPDHPGAEEHPPLASDFEAFDPQPKNVFSFQFQAVPSTPRLWLKTQDEIDLIQIQSDRFIRNWRQATACSYPRYENLRNQFVDDYRKFVGFVASSSFGDLQPNQCEVSYVNTIDIPGSDDAHRSLERIFTFWRHAPTKTAASEFENASLQMRQIIRSMPNKARLVIAVEPIIRGHDLRQFIRFTLTMRGQPSGSGSIEDIVGFFNESRNVIVQRFAELTTDEMHKLWRRTNAA